MLRVPVSCMQCQQERGMPNVDTLATALIPDDNMVWVQCPEGHQTLLAVQQTRFELLSGLAVAAIADGYHREAVTSFNGSLERLYEFYWRASARQRGIPDDTVRRVWQAMRKQSERQLGAFMATWLADTGGHPALLRDSDVSTRNAVVHNGKFPTREEAIRFGQAVADVVSPVLARLGTADMEPTVWKLTHEHLAEMYAKGRAQGVLVSTASFPAPFSLGAVSDRIDIEAAVQAQARWASMLAAESRLMGRG